MRQLKITQSITNRESQSLDKYLHEIGKVDLITAEEEVILAQRIREGDQVALEKLTKTNLRFVVSVAKQYQNQGLTLGDLINEGNLDLLRAAKRFDETKGFKNFISYAYVDSSVDLTSYSPEQSRITSCPYIWTGQIQSAATKLPVANATVILQPAGRSVMTDAKGYYRLTSVCAGDLPLSRIAGVTTPKYRKLIVKAGNQWIATANRILCSQQRDRQEGPAKLGIGT
ncbi:hypothetical protein FQR65_LT15219 [Abscondita terminalis]|nr:hypothetical protein FQR65_LT15219 [Abscondita terminalis]